MDFELSDVELALAESVRALCAGRFSLEWLKEVASDARPEPVETRRWLSLAEAGVFSLQVPEPSGGVGLGMGAAAVVFEELGRALVPGPLVCCHLAARDLGRALPGVGEGGVLATALRASGEPGISAELSPILVHHLEAADWVVVIEEDGLFVVSSRDVAATPVRSLDPLTSVAKLNELPRGEKVADARSAARWTRDASLLTAALLVGLASKCVEMAVEYAKTREQFGRTIGSFQAIKHMCADMLVRAETARVAVQAAAVTIDQPEVGEAERLSAGAALLASQAALLNAEACIQVHGGMGFTWEVPAHLYLKRSKMLSDFFGSERQMAELVAQRF